MSEDDKRFSWGHININVRNLDRSVAFYEKLGFSMLIPAIPYLSLRNGSDPSPVSDVMTKALGLETPVRGRACIMQLGDGFPKLDLTEFWEQELRDPLKNKDLGLVRICLSTQDLQAEYVRLSDLGVTFLDTPKTADHGLAEIALCEDPDGTLIELLQVYPERWASLLKPSPSHNV